MPRYDREFLGGAFKLSVDSDPTVTNGIVKFGETGDWVQFNTLAGRVGLKFMMESTATTGTAWGQQIRMKCSAAHANDATSCAVGLNVSASTGIAGASGLQAIQGYTQPSAAQAGTTCINAALYGCSDHPTGVDVLARTWTLWVDCHCDVVSSGGQYMARFSNNANPTNGAVIDGLFTVYPGAGMTNFVNFELVAAPIAVAAGKTLTSTHAITVKVGTDTRYIMVGTYA
jgi:hypothetical protein